MLRIALAFVLLSLTGVAHAQAPLSARLRVERRSEHGCSQSHASTSETIDLALSLDRAGGVELIVERVAHHSFGPSFGRFQAGDRDFSYTTDRETHRFTGRARQAGGALVIELDRREHASITHEGFADVALPPAQASAASVVVECRDAAHEVWPAPSPSHPEELPAADERASTRSGMTCAVTGLPSSLATLGGEPLPFVRGAPIVLHVHEGWGQTHRLLRLR